MSFDVFLLSFRDGRNGPADAAAARAVLERYKFRHEPEFDAFHVEFSDGSSVEMFSGGLDGASEEFDGAMFALRGSSEGIGEFIFEFSLRRRLRHRAGNGASLRPAPARRFGGTFAGGPD